MLTRYVTASNWDDLVRAMREYVCWPQLGFDGLVQVKDRSKCDRPVRQLKSTRIIVYDHVNDIPSLLQTDGLQSTGVSTTLGHGEPTTPAQIPDESLPGPQSTDEGDDDAPPAKKTTSRKKAVKVI